MGASKAATAVMNFRVMGEDLPGSQQDDRQQAEATLATLPAPTPGGLERLPLAEKLLAEGTRPADLAKAPRRAPLGLPPMPAYCESLRLTDQGVVLGKGTVIAALDDRADGGTGLVIDADRIIALLAVASGTMPAPEPVIRQFACASRALAKGDPTLAAIVLAQLGQPPLAHSGFAKALALAADELGRGTDPVVLMKGLGMVPVGKERGELRKDTESGKTQDRDDDGCYACEGRQSMSETAADYSRQKVISELATGMGVDPKLVLAAGDDGAAALAGVSNFQFLDKHGQESVLRQIDGLKVDNPELAGKLLATVGDIMVNPAWVPAAASDKQLDDAIKFNGIAGTIAGFLVGKTPIPAGKVALVGLTRYLEQAKITLQQEKARRTGDMSGISDRKIDPGSRPKY